MQWIRRSSFLFIVFALSCLILNSNDISAAESEIVPLNVAMEVVKKHIDEIEKDNIYYKSWGNREIDLELGRKLYDIDDSIIAYYIKLKNNDTNIGYYIVSARKDITPILEYSDAPTHPDFELSNNNKIYYFGGISSIAAKDKIDLIEKFEQIKSNKIKLLEREVNNPKISLKETQKQISELQQLKLQDLSIKKDPYAKDDWDAYLNNKNDQKSNAVILSDLPSQYQIPNVPHVYQYSSGIDGPNSACGPSTAAIIAEHLKNLGKNVDGTTPTRNMIQLVNYIRNGPWMYVGFLGINETGFRDGFRNYLNKNYSGNPWSVSIIYGDQNYALETFKNRIVSSRPPAVMWYKPWNINVEENWHWQVAFAYRVNPTTWRTEFTVKEPSWPSSNPNRTFEYVANSGDFLYMRIIEQ